MICARCADATYTDPCPSCGRCPLIDRRYRLDWVVDRSARGITWRGTRIEDGLAVAIKKVPIDPGDVCGRANREIAILRQLAHPRIPAYLDRFVAGIGDHRGVYLIQSFVGGRTLAAEMLDRRHREEEVLAMVVEIAAILSDLHDLRPRVVHGNVEPGNIIRRGGDGALVLVDFAAVHDGPAGPADNPNVGTYGFTAPERYRGEASPASDLFALGVTAAVLLTRQPADALGEYAAEWRRFVDVHPETAALLDGLLAPELPDRFDDARRVIAWTERARAAIHRDRQALSRSAKAPGGLLPETRPMMSTPRPATTGPQAPVVDIWQSEADGGGLHALFFVLGAMLLGAWLILH